MRGGDILIKPDATVKDALRQLDKSAEKVLIVVDENLRLKGALTDGDIRRSLLAGSDLSSTIENVYNTKPRFIYVEDFAFDRIKQLLLTYKIELLPVVEKDMTVVDFITWDKVFSEKKDDESEILAHCPLVIMAGGKGTRLEPFTKILPKPLIPIGDKPIIQVIVDKFKARGTKKFSFIVNYKGEMIESYFRHLSDEYDINYLWEKDFFGTAGGLKMMEEQIDGDFFVSNCDVIIRAKYENILELHRQQNAALTIVSAIQHYRIPYGVVDFQTGGDVVNIHEKPEFTFTVNTGLYVLNKRALSLIPDSVHMDMTDLINLLIKNGDRVITYPVNENEYIDIGQWEEYKKSVSKLQVIDG
jgi:dTDP-glucose pyrophosphorylase